jgi:hypothetical protein
MKCYGVCLREHNGNIESIIFLLKKIPLPLPKTQKRKKKLSLLSLLIGCMKFLFPKWFVTFFNLDYYCSLERGELGSRD